MSKPLQIGVTGGIGSGKSFICEIFKRLGVPVYEADTRARWLMDNDPDLKKRLIDTFGEETYKNNQLDRKYLAERVFNRSDEVKKLNALVHPVVARDYENWVDQHTSSPYVMKEAALMFESGSSKYLDEVVTVTADTELRIKRVKQRDPHRSIEEIQSIMQKQLPQDQMVERSDFTINNDGTEMILPQVINLHTLFAQDKQKSHSV